MNNVNVYQPQLSVKLWKTINRRTVDGTTPVAQRFMQPNQSLELTAWLGDGGGVHTSKSIRQPAGGWQVTLVDQPYASGGSLESLYGLIEPQDYVEVRFRHGPAAADSNPSKIPILMRGFVGSVQRTEVMGADGKPSRAVVVRGQDYGKILSLLRIQYLPGYVIGQDILTAFKLFEHWGAGFTTSLSVNDFLSQVVTAIVNPFLQSLMPANSTNPTNINPLASVQGTTSVTSIQTAQGSIWEILRDYCDVGGGWNELFTQDTEQGVNLVLRPAPFLDLAGKKIQSDAPDLKPIVVPDSDVISLDVQRSDANVSNYFWTRAPLYDMNGDNLYRMLWGVGASSDSSISTAGYLNSAVQYYGTRYLQVDTQCGASDIKSVASGKSAAENATRDDSMFTWIQGRREALLAANKDNAMLESGTMRIRANEAITPGNYVQLVRGDFRALYYVTGVDTDIVPFAGAFQTLHVERGTGFAERISAGGVQSPYLSEMTNAANGA
ncbi:hypothetical protein [Burkholderia glumae]|uniref:hypothetical protein n=1 Tax=Burkholderia glumae TaxID=337 RepID=UPI002151BBE5|nr:hypothetical protein [Burkholderia glumae]UVS96353.1 hypothetical protein EFP19_11735 [Burkholderia glumae]